MLLTRPKQSGFTLVEMIMVIVITGIIGGMVAIFIKAPVQGYVDSARRAEMTDVADTALRRLSRDIRTAVPNSVRVANCGGTPTCVEFIPTRDGGRYRATQDCTGACIGNVLDFGTTDGSADIIGAPINFVAGDFIVIGSTQSNGNAAYDQTITGVLRAHSNAKTGSQTTIDFTNTALPIWAQVDGQRFDVVDGAQQAVTYACEGVSTNASGDGTGVLNRYDLYNFNSTQLPPTSLGVTPAILADKVSDCVITYDSVNQRNGLVAIRLGITRSGETVSLYHTIHVNNVP